MISVRPEHYPNVPQFLHGHNAKADPPRKPVLRPVLTCACGCGEMAAPGKQYVSGHNSRGRRLSEESRRKTSKAMTGERNHRFGRLGESSASWKGGLQRGPGGYVLEYRPEHPYARKRYVMQHRLIAEAHLRETDPSSEFLVEVDGERYISPKADVHHDNEVKDDNRLENLVVMWRGDHTRYHILQRYPNAKVTR
jgi:hypothetical protein